MRPDILQSEVLKILSATFFTKEREDEENQDQTFLLDDNQMFHLWNLLGEELGIDLSLATENQRKLLFESYCAGKKIVPKDLSSLLWLVYYSDL
ncbi:MAG: hypothetical protein K2X39_03480 [Silvanigrellaceae bacterium]|nr:hypothetical protein [Silvanigrellaceae bacterium]